MIEYATHDEKTPANSTNQDQKHTNTDRIKYENRTISEPIQTPNNRININRRSCPNTMNIIEAIIKML